MGQRWGGEINLYFPYFLSFIKNILALFHLSADLGLQSTFSAKSGGSHLTTSQQYTKAALSLGEERQTAVLLSLQLQNFGKCYKNKTVCLTCPFFQGVRPVSKE